MTPLRMLCFVLLFIVGGYATASARQTTWVETFDQEYFNWATTHVDTFQFPPANLYEQVYAHMTIACPGPPGDCDPWDRFDTMQLRHYDTDSTHVDYEIGRLVTPYDITYGDPSTSCSWVFDVTAYQFLLHDEVTLTMYIDTWIGGIEGWFAFMLAMAFLMFRPQGLFGDKIIERV